MHSLKVIKTVSVEALDGEEPDAAGMFHTIVDPGTVLEMAEIIETLLQRLDETGADPTLVSDTKITLRGRWENSPPIGEADVE